METAAKVSLTWKPPPPRKVIPHCQPQRHKGAFSCGRRKSDYAILLSMQNRRVTSLGISTKVLMLDSLCLDEIPCKESRFAMSKRKSES